MVIGGAALDAQYDNHAAAGEAGVQALLRLRAAASRNRARCDVRTGIQYGDHPALTLDFYPPGNGEALAPCLALVHGGGWISGDAASAGFWGECVSGWGVAHAVITHAKIPDATLAGMAAQIEAAWAFLHDQGTALGIDTRRLHLAGISSGATLAALAGIAVRSHAPPASLLLMGGMYDLEPVRRSFRNQHLRLSEQDARMLSPLYRARALPGRVVITHGAQETDAFCDQARRLAAAIGPRATLLEIPDANHFSQAEAMLDPKSELAMLTRSLLTDPLVYAVADQDP